MSAYDLDERVSPEVWQKYIVTKALAEVAEERARNSRAHAETVRGKSEEKVRKVGMNPEKRAKVEEEVRKSVAYAERRAKKAEEDAKKARKRATIAKGHAIPPWHDLELRGRPRLVPPPKKEEKEEVKPAKKAKC